MMCMILLTASIVQHYGVQSTASHVVTELSDLPLASGHPEGTRAIVAGKIADDAEPLLKHFVAYVEEVYRAGGKQQSTRWDVLRGQTQAFAIETPSGRVLLSRLDYTLSPRVSETNAPLFADWDHVAARIVEPPTTWESAHRFRGLVVGQPVIAVGTVVGSGVFDADYVVGTDLEDVRKRLADVASGETTAVSRWLAALAALGLVLTIGMFARARIKRFCE